MALINCPHCGQPISDVDSVCSHCYRSLKASVGSAPPSVIVQPTPSSARPASSSQGAITRFLLERVAFLATAGIPLALPFFVLSLLASSKSGEISELVSDTLLFAVGLPVWLSLLYLFAYLFGKVLLNTSIGSLYAHFPEGAEAPEWAKKRFSWRRFLMEYVYFFGVVLFFIFMVLIIGLLKNLS